jgi:hypothetical protein
LRFASGRQRRAEKMSLTELAERVSLEARCCPFLDFAMPLSGSGGPAKLRLTGGPGVKEFFWRRSSP